MQRMTVFAEELAPGDEVLYPQVTIKEVTVRDGGVSVTTEGGYPVGYPRRAVVGILREVKP